MKKMLYCYHGEINGVKKIAIPQIRGGYDHSGEYEIYTISLEKSEDDVKGKYVLVKDNDAVYNRRDFNSKKYKFNSINVKDPVTLKRTIRMVMVELENKSAVAFGGKIISETPLTVKDGTYIEVARNYTFTDNPDYIQKITIRYMGMLSQEDLESLNLRDEGVKSEEVSEWVEDCLTIEDLGMEHLEVDFLGEMKYSEGTMKPLGYNSSLGLIGYEEGSAEHTILERLERRGNKVKLGIVIYKDFIRLLVDNGSYVVEKKDMVDWKDKLKLVIEPMVNKFKIKEMIILQQVEKINRGEESSDVFKYVLKKDSIYKED